MKRLLLSIFAFFIMTSFTAVWAKQQDGPSINLHEKTFDAGEVREGEEINHSFKVLNTGNQSLEIKKVTTT